MSHGRSRRSVNTAELRPWRRAALGGAVLALFVGLGLCWALTAPEGPSETAAPLALALGSAVLLVGFGLLPTVGAEPAPVLVGLTGGAGAVAAGIAVWLRTADQAGVAAVDVRVGQFATVVSAGAPELVLGAAALLTLGWAGLTQFSAVTPPVAAVAVLGGIGVLSFSVSGHAGTHAWAPVVVAVHALAAAWWCGLLAAMVLSVRGRGGWAAALPEFSAKALWAVLALTGTGVAAAAVELGAVGDLVTSGYGRVLLAKTSLLVALVGLAWWHRRRWLPGAQRHRVAEEVSLRRAMLEVLVLAVVLGLAVGLSGTPPPR